jgi:hypothetical protein
MLWRQCWQTVNCHTCRNSDMQLALLDRIAGTQAAAAEFGGQLRRLRELGAQLAAIEALGDEDKRDALQSLVDEVCCMHRCWVMCTWLAR